jgi:hypothetical protein
MGTAPSPSRWGQRLARKDNTVNFACESLHTGGRNRVERDELIAQVKRLLAPGADVALLYLAGDGDDVTHPPRGSSAAPDTPNRQLSSSN